MPQERLVGLTLLMMISQAREAIGIVMDLQDPTIPELPSGFSWIGYLKKATTTNIVARIMME